eukprot:gnl/TRDRNA2_/TRDRNA2_146990_c0_seq1.p1 gnl/TRDRNA2_/TRDRNA2_146990_c0~~gnl/TRDRNA2_/TRDRNA2_146990_c0_seq1.p1  ORF type:complete len:319 (-),score=28.69 gnl/TRDRNA2_/TRDRNA2_146990_c0_seq1:62-955(-)
MYAVPVIIGVRSAWHALAHGPRSITTGTGRPHPAFLWIVLFGMLVLQPVRFRPGFLDWWLFHLNAKYFSFRCVWPKSLPRKQYIVMSVPHGVLPLSTAIFPLYARIILGTPLRSAAASIVLRLPIIRQVALWSGATDASRDNLRSRLRAGDTLLVVPDGIAGIFCSPSEELEPVRLRNRRGIARLALESGVPVLPTFGFGNTSGLSALSTPGMESLSRWCQVSFLLPYGRWGLPVPRREPMLLAVGEPVHLPKPAEPGRPSDSEVEAAHQQLLAAIEAVFEEHKVAYGWSHRRLCWK